MLAVRRLASLLLLATAAPAGPAFEGGAIRCGMRAAEGAIEGVTIADDGPGYAPDVIDRLGEPYVTTRRAGARNDRRGRLISVIRPP